MFTFCSNSFPSIKAIKEWMIAKERKKEVEVEEEEEAQGKERTERTERGFDHRILSECASLFCVPRAHAQNTKKSQLFLFSRSKKRERSRSLNLSLTLKREFAFSQTRAIRGTSFEEERVSQRGVRVASTSHAIETRKWSKKKNKRFILSLKKFTYSSSCVIVHS